MQAISFTPQSTAVVPTSAAAVETVASSNTPPPNTVASSNTSSHPDNLNNPTIPQSSPIASNSNRPLIITELDKLCNKREEWELNAYKRSNDQLYEILAQCLTIYEKLSEDHKQRQLFRSFCEDLKKEGVLTFNDGTHLTTRIVRYVFRNCGKRSFAYAKALQVAQAAKITPKQLPNWLIEQGGVEQVRRAAKQGPTPKQQADSMRSFAADTFADQEPLVGDIKPDTMFEPDANADHMFALALLRKEDDGTISLIYGTNNSTLINKILVFAGKEMSSAQKDADKNTKRKADNAQRNEIVNAA